MASAVMAAVIVWPGRHGLRLNTAPPTPPATMATIIVSPSAREKPTISAATMPDTAAGNDDAHARGALARAEAERGLAQRAGHRVHRVLGDRRDERRDEDAHREAGRRPC